MKSLGRILAGMPLLALTATSMTPAVAQSQSTTPTAGGSASGGVGLGSASRSDVTFSVNARYDSNVPRLNDDTVTVSRLEKEDIRISPAVQLNLVRNLGRHQIGLRSLLGYDFYVRNSELNRERLIVEPSAYLNLPVCDLSLQGIASRQQSDLGQIVYVGIDPTVGADNTETRKGITGRLLCGDTYGLRPTLEVERTSGSNSNPLRRIANYDLTRIQPGVGYSSPGLGEISVYAVKQDTDLPNQILLNGQGSGYTLRGFGVRYQRAIGTRLSFDGSLSHIDVTPYGAANSGRSGLNGSVALTLLASDRLQFMAFANRNFTSTLTAVSTYQLEQGYGLSANYAANDRLRLRLAGSVSPRRFFYTVTPTGPFIAEQTQHDISAGASYNLNRRMRLNLDAGYQKRDADLNVFDYESFYAGVGVSFSL